jgi:hypothetical protein
VPTLRCLGVLLVQETAAVVLVEHGTEAPWAVRKRLYVLDLDKQHVTRLGTFDIEGPGQVVYPCQVAVLDIVRAIVIADLSSGPVEALDVYGLARFDGGRTRDYILPSGIFL